MDVSRIQPGRGLGNDNSMPAGFDLKQIFFTNLQLLGFDAAAMEIKYKIPFNKDMFNLPNKAGAEAVLYFLFNRLNPVMCRQEFRDCWPVSDKKTESTFRKICCIWLQNIQKEEADARLPRINASLFLSPGGDKFCHLLLAFSSYVMLHVIRKEHGVKEDGVLGYPTLTSQNKEMGGVMETTVNCCAVRHRKQFFTTVEQMAYMKERWQHFADELTRKYRSLSKDVRSLEREKRDQVQKAAQGCVQRGSPVPADRMSHDFNMSAHTASRAQRVQQVRGLWKGVESFLERSKGEKEVVTAIIDRTLEKYTLDAANIQISIPHLMLLECEQEIRRRKVDNIYEGGQLNLVSVLQLWNLALEMYIRRLNRDGLKDLSQEAEMMKGQAHAHQAYLANASALREKMAAEVSVKKKSVAQLRRRFRADASLSGLSMSAPSPPVTFEPPQGHSGHTPTGPVLQMTPNQVVDTPEAAIDIANSVSRSSRRHPVKPFHTSAFGVDMNQNKNWSNSNRLPRPVEKSGLPGSKASQQAARLLAGTKGRAEIQPRVIRHISRQSAAPPPSAHKKAPASSSVKKTRASSAVQQASTPERKVAPTSRQNDVDKTPVPAGASSNAVETPRQRAHNILADKIVWAVMHGSEDEEISSHHYGLSPAHPSSASKPSVLPSSSIDLSHFQSLSLPTTASPSMPRSARPMTTQASAPTVQDTSQGTVDAAYSPAAGRQRHRSDTAGDISRFGVATSPVTLVQQARLRQDSDSSDESEGGGGDTGRAARTQGDGGELEVDDVNVQDPIAALSEEAFITHDLIHRSPLAFDIRRMWKDAISDDAGEGDDADSKHHTADWRDSDRSSAGSARVLTPTIPQSPASSDTSPSPRRLQPSSVVVHTHSPSALENKRSTNDIRASGGGHAKPYAQRVEERPVESSQTVMINNTMTFYTSFDEDSLQGNPDREAEDSPVEWEERLSALYDDSDHPETDASEGKGDRNTNDLAFNSALDTLFQAKSPQRAAGVGDSAVEHGATPVRKVDSPLIFFTPHQPAPCGLGQGSEVQLKHVTPALSQKASHDVATEDGAGLTDRAPPPAAQRGVQGPWRGATDGAGMSPETASDKENHGSLTSQDKRYGFNQASGKNSSDSVTTTPVKKVTFSPGKPSSDAGHTQVEEGLWRGGDLTNVSGTSPLNDSFTPLQSGLFLQGKSPGRSSLEQVWSDQRGQTSSSSAVPSFMDTVNLDNLDQSLVAQLRRLQQVKAEAFSRPAPGGDGERKEEEPEGADGGATLSWPVTVHRPATVGEEEELPMSAAKPWGILDEDDSVLLPSSP